MPAFPLHRCMHTTEAADNVFYYLTYEGAVDLASGDRDATELKALETQINEFG